MATGGYRLAHYLGTTLFTAAALLGLGYAVATQGAPPRGFFLDPIEAARRFEAEGRYVEAAREYRTLARLDPADLDAYRAWAEALDSAGDPDAALRAYLDSVAARPHDSTAHTRLGAAFLERGRTDDALGSLTTALRLRPTNVAALTLVGDLMRQRGRPAQAAETYRRALAVAPTAIVHNKLGIAFADLGQFEAALAQFEGALALEPGLEEARINRDRARDYLARPAAAPERP